MSMKTKRIDQAHFGICSIRKGELEQTLQIEGRSDKIDLQGILLGFSPQYSLMCILFCVGETDKLKGQRSRDVRTHA